MDDASYKQLVWSAEEYEASGFGRSLGSAKGLEVLRACGQVQVLWQLCPDSPAARVTVVRR